MWFMGSHHTAHETPLHPVQIGILCECSAHLLVKEVNLIFLGQLIEHVIAEAWFPIMATQHFIPHGRLS
jgi:hypothetical protein